MSGHRGQVEVKPKDKQPVVRERGLRQEAVIAWALVYNLPADVCAAWTDEDYEKFYQDCRECMAEIDPQLFRRENIRMSAEHYDEGIPPEENDGVIDRHLHDLGISKGVDGRHCGNLIDAKRRNSGLSANKHLGQKARQMADGAAGVLDQAAAEAAFQKCKDGIQAQKEAVKNVRRLPGE